MSRSCIDNAVSMLDSAPILSAPVVNAPVLSARAIARAQRAIGVVRLAVRPRAGATTVERLYQCGPLRARIVRAEPGNWATAVLLNTAGGVAGGDDLSVAVTASPGAALTLATQGAERIYRAGLLDRPSRITTEITLGDAASLEFLPQETIIYDRSRLVRRLSIDMAATASFLGVDMLVFGRAAMGETVHDVDLSDLVELRRAGTLVFRDALRPPASFAATRDRAATFGGAAGVATVLYAASDAAGRLDDVRAALDGTEAGASAWNGLLLVRILAQTGAAVRAATRRVLTVLRDDRALPRVWYC